MVQVYKEPLCRRYYGSIVGEAFLFRVFAYLSLIVLAFVIAFATGGFWPKLNTEVTQADVRYTYDALLIFEGSEPGQSMVWSTASTINTQFSEYFTPASVRVASEDVNNDGKADVISFVATTTGAFPVHGVKALLQMHYRLSGNLKMDMYSFAYVQHSSAMPGAALYTDGELVLAAKSQPVFKEYSSLYNVQMLNSTTPSVQQTVQPTAELELQTILRNYNDRNYTTVYTNNYPVWVGGSDGQFELNMLIRVPPNQVTYYRPTAIYMLKVAWIQWLATFVVLWWLWQYTEYFFFYYRLVEARVVSDFKPKNQRF